MDSGNVSVGALKSFHGPWEKEDSKIVIGIDIGTTQSGVAYTYLQKGVDQTLQRVLSWPGQEDQGGYGKIPTLVYYDANNKASPARYFGAEALSPQAEDDAEEEGGWHLVEHFKLHLHPSDLQNDHDLEKDPLPRNISLSQIYSDFLGYLLRHTQRYFEERILDGERVWRTYKPTMDVVIAHPNGWGIREQDFLRKAAVAAGFTSEKQTAQSVHFVTEAEASVHFCTHYTDLKNHLRPGINFAVCDAGGSTVDTTVYTVKSIKPLLQLEETCASACVQSGAIYVDRAVKRGLNDVFRKARIPAEDIKDFVKQGVKDFEARAKRRFREVSVDQRIQIASTKYDNLEIKTRRGSMRLTGNIVKSFFDRCVNDIIASIRSQLGATAAPVPYIILVGGFGESPYLREQLKACFSDSGPQVTTTNEATSKAVADGALIWRCVSSVVGRAPRYSFGVESMTPFKGNEKEHQNRQLVVWPSAKFVKGVWSQIVTKGIPIDSETVSRRAYYREYGASGLTMPKLSEDIYCHAFGGSPKWLRTSSGTLSPGFKRVCAVTANLNDLRNALQPSIGPSGTEHWTLRFSVCIRFGHTELQAYVEWLEDGKTRTGEAKIIPSSELV